MIHPYLSALPSRFEDHRNPHDAGFMKKYLKNKFEFYGIKTPVRNEIIKKYFRDFGLPEKNELAAIMDNLWSLNEREFQYFGCTLLEKYKKEIEKEDINLFEKLIIKKSWWDTVDGLAAWNVGDYFKKFPSTILPYVKKWFESDYIWLQRTILIFQLKYKKSTNENLLYEYCIKLASSKEFFIQKAIGWSLREYAKTNPESVKAFVVNHQLPSLSKREALKHLKI